MGPQDLIFLPWIWSYVRKELTKGQEYIFFIGPGIQSLLSRKFLCREIFQSLNCVCVFFIFYVINLMAEKCFGTKDPNSIAGAYSLAM